MIHNRQGLTLVLEAGDDLLRVHAELDDLEGDFAPDRLSLYGEIHHAAAALAEHFGEFVRPNTVAGFLRHHRFGTFVGQGQRPTQHAGGAGALGRILRHRRPALST